MGAVPAEIFEGRHYGAIFGTVITAAILGGAMGPWLVGGLHDQFGSYAPGFWISIGLNLVSAAAIWLAGPRKVRVVAGRINKATAK
jgi:MFS family permease